MDSHRSPEPVYDPVCGMPLAPEQAAARLQVESGTVFFCSAGCRDRFQLDPARYSPAAGSQHTGCDHGRALGNNGLAAIGIPAGAGLAAALGLLTIYFSVLTPLSGWRFTLREFEVFWPYITALAFGFGIQVGLFLFLRRSVHAAHRTGRVVAATGSSSGVAMLSCCTHYLVNLLPVLGASGLASFVGQYQVELFWVGLAANLAGIGYMVSRIRAFSRAGTFAGQTAMAGLLAVSFVLGVTDAPASAGEAGLKMQESYEGRVMIEVTPLSVAEGTPWRFQVRLNTHSVALNHDMADSTVLLAADGQEMPALEWVGDPAGGHHRSGVLVFDPLVPAPDSITLKIRGVAADERVFTWRP